MSELVAAIVLEVRYQLFLSQYSPPKSTCGFYDTYRERSWFANLQRKET